MFRTMTDEQYLAEGKARLAELTAMIPPEPKRGPDAMPRDEYRRRQNEGHKRWVAANRERYLASRRESERRLRARKTRERRAG